MLTVALTLAWLPAGAVTDRAANAENPPPADNAGGDELHDDAHGAFQATTHRRFDDVEYWSGVFDDPERDSWQKPVRILESLAPEPGHAVADIGAGTGYMIERLGRAVGATGSVFALEVEAELVDHMRSRAEAAGLTNVVPVLSSRTHPSLPALGIDRVLILDSYHHLDDRRSWLAALLRTLAPGARVLIVDWLAGELDRGPPPDHKIAAERVIAEMESAGFRLLERDEDLPFHYRLCFEARTE